jgi:hypothetical protein
MRNNTQVLKIWIRLDPAWWTPESSETKPEERIRVPNSSGPPYTEKIEGKVVLLAKEALFTEPLLTQITPQTSYPKPV